MNKTNISLGKPMPSSTDLSLVPYQIPASWTKCDAMVLVWPSRVEHDAILEFYEALACVLPDYTDLIILTPPGESLKIKSHFESMQLELEYISFHETKTPNAFIGQWGPMLLAYNNQFHLFKSERYQQDFWLEADQLFPIIQSHSSNISLMQGFMESDGNKLALVNEHYWSCHSFNQDVSVLQNFIQEKSNIQHFIRMSAPEGLNYIPLRICRGNKILRTNCVDETSVYHKTFSEINLKLEQQLAEIGGDYEVIDLPWIGELTNELGENFLADYSQFIIVNNAIILPIFNLPTDEDAMDIVSKIYPECELLGFPCSALSLINAQLPQICLGIPEGVMEPFYE